MVGGGLPFAMHFREMAGPGCKVCSVNLKRKKGRASERWKKGVSSSIHSPSIVELQTIEKDMSTNVEYPLLPQNIVIFRQKALLPPFLYSCCIILLACTSKVSLHPLIGDPQSFSKSILPNPSHIISINDFKKDCRFPIVYDLL